MTGRFRLLLALVFGCVAGAAVYGVLNHIGKLTGHGFRPAMAVTRSQMQQIATALDAYEVAQNARPASLRKLVEAGRLPAAALLDDRRSDREALLARGVCDVLYLPAVRPDDPRDCVVLCTLLLRAEDDRFPVVFNDGTIAELAPRELVGALNRTYTYLYGRMPKD